MMMQEAFVVEDILMNESNTNRTFMHTCQVEKNFVEKKICSPKLGLKKN
jgi:hypothetical protein